MDYPLISIIITAYNYAHTLVEAVDSACGQTYPNIEVLVLDNASQDNTPEVMERYLNHPRVRYFRNPRNIGAARNHNRGVIESRGEYLNFLSADDRMAPTLVAASYGYLQAHPHVDIAYSELDTMDVNGVYTGRRRAHNPCMHDSNPNEFPSFLAFGCYAAFETMLIPRWVFGVYGLLDDTLIGADFELMIRWAAQGLSFGYIPEAMLTYRLHAQQDSGHDSFLTTGRFLHEFLYILDKHLTPENIARIGGYEFRILRHIHAKFDLVTRHGYVDDGELQAKVDAVTERLQELRKIHDADLPAPQCSIFVLANQSGDDLKKTLNSLVEQSYQEWEALILQPLHVPRQTNGILDPRCKILSFTEEITTAQALNTGFRLARGNCYTFLHAGNTLPPDHIGRLIWAFSQYPLEVYLTPATLVIDHESSAVEYPVFSEPGLYADALIAPNCPLEALAFRREVIDRLLTFSHEMEVLFEWQFRLRLEHRLNIGVLSNSTVYLHERVGTPSRYAACPKLPEDLDKVYLSHPVDDPQITQQRVAYRRTLVNHLRANEHSRWSAADHIAWYERLTLKPILRHTQAEQVELC